MGLGGMTAFRPNIDVYEDEKALKVHAELPGMKKEDIKVPSPPSFTIHI